MKAGKKERRPGQTSNQSRGEHSAVSRGVRADKLGCRPIPGVLGELRPLQLHVEKAAVGTICAVETECSKGISPICARKVFS